MPGYNIFIVLFVLFILDVKIRCYKLLRVDVGPEWRCFGFHLVDVTKFHPVNEINPIVCWEDLEDLYTMFRDDPFEHYKNGCAV